MTQPVEMARLTQDVYLKFEQQLGQPVVTQATTELQAGYMLGIQHALKLLREGFVVGTPGKSR